MIRNIVSRWKHKARNWSARACGLDEESQLENQARQLTASQGRRRQQIRENIVLFINSNSEPAATAAQMGRRLLTISPNNTYDVTRLMCTLGFEITRRCFLEVAEASDDDPNIPDDYLFAVTRALGPSYCGHGSDSAWSLVEIALSNPNSASMREAAVFVLQEIGDDVSKDHIQRIADSDEVMILRRIAREALREIQDG